MAPEHLYKYRKVDLHLEAMLLRGEVCVPSPVDFNDPFDCWLPVDPMGTEEELGCMFREYLRDKEPGLCGRELEEGIDKEVSRRQHEQPGVIHSEARQAIARVLAKTGVYSLSATNKHILMWSHYADDHKGVCLEFSLGSAPALRDRATKVTYKEELPCMSFFDPKLPGVLMTTKSDAWSYEQEWRIVFPEPEGPGLKSIPDGALSGVILGCRMSEADRKRIMCWVNLREEPLAVYRAQMKDREFGLDIVPVL